MYEGIEYLASTVHHNVHINYDVRDALVTVHGVGGRTVQKLKRYDLNIVRNVKPKVVILEIGTNDLTMNSPESVATEIVTFCHMLHDHHNVKHVYIAQIIQRTRQPTASFNRDVQTCNDLLRSTTKGITYMDLWTHKGLNNPSINIIRTDGVHLNDAGNYTLYRSYRGAILHALKKLHTTLVSLITLHVYQLYIKKQIIIELNKEDTVTGILK